MLPISNCNSINFFPTWLFSPLKKIYMGSFYIPLSESKKVVFILIKDTFLILTKEKDGLKLALRPSNSQ